MNASRVLLAGAMIPLIAGCVPPGLQRGGHQPDLDCPADLAQYCGGWTVYDVTEILEPEKHLQQSDAFVIGRKSNGNVPLMLFPRAAGTGGLLRRWNGRQSIDLQERATDGDHDCMVGRVRLPSHGPSAPPHEWHALTIRVETVVTPEIGKEDEITICLNPQNGGGWPERCAPLNCNEEGSDPVLNHGGRAHARD